MTFVEASRAWLAVQRRSLPFRLTVLIEGDEEGDPAILTLPRGQQGDFWPPMPRFVCDTGMWRPTTPAIVTSLRGCIGEEVTITGPRIDLHSGYYGGPAVNPIKVLSRILASVHDKNGRSPFPASTMA